jgi:RNA-directed DNA polymerase
MIQKELFDERERLFERLCETATLRQGFAAVKANGGSPGTDGVSVKEFECRLEEELAHLKAELEGWSYKPRPVRRVEIPKPGGKGVRLLGVPCIRDRVVQASLKLLLEPLFDPYFSESSYGFRPGKNQRQAVEAAQRIVQSGKEHVVDIDLSRFFDRINQDRLLYRVQQRVSDNRIIRLIGLTLRSGVMTAGGLVPTTEGTTQGSPLSPLLSNIVLDELDKELERRGLSFCRFADDSNIFVGSRKAAERVMKGVTKLIEKRMKLTVNREKSKVALAVGVKFLGMTIVVGTLAISTLAMDRAREKIRTLTLRRSSKTVEATIEEINRWYRGWAGYFEMTQYPSQFATLEAHIRRRLRARLVRNMKRRRTIAEKLRKHGISSRLAQRTAYSHQNWWALSHAPAIERLYSNRWFMERGLFVKSTENLPHWFGPRRLIKIP